MFIPEYVATGYSGVIFYHVFRLHFENIFIAFVQIINNMQHIVKRIKAVTKKYETKSGEKESISKRVDIGVTDLFETGECVVVISKTNFDKLNKDSTDVAAKLEKDIAAKDEIIDANNESIANFKAEIETKTNKIAELSKEIKALKNTVEKLESDISAKDDAIDKLTADVESKDKKLSDSDETISDLNAKLDEVKPTVDKLKELLLSKDSTIAELDKQIAIYDAIDVDKLTIKADELDKSKNIIIRLQNEKTEYLQLVNYHKERATAYKNQGVISKMFGNDAAAEITAPVLYLIDMSGISIKKDDETESAGDDNAASKPDVNSSGDDDVKLI